MYKPSWKDIAELIGIAAIVASLIFVGWELKQNREVAIATAKDSTTGGWRELNFERMNADWYWEIVRKVNDVLDEPGPYILGLPVSTRDKWRTALDSLSPEEYGRFVSFHLQEMNEAERLYELSLLGLTSFGGDDGSNLARIRAPLWAVMLENDEYEIPESYEFGRVILQYAGDSGQ